MIQDGGTSSTFPGEKSPGLIEASVAFLPNLPILIGFPGEKSPGLIEA